MRNVLFAFLLMFIAPYLHAAEVVKVKGKSVLIKLKGDPAVTGDNFFVVGRDGKRRGTIQITRVKGDNAIGRITRGNAAAGNSLEFRAQKGTAKKAAPSPKMAAPSHQDGSTAWVRSYWGVLGGISMDSMSVNVKGPPPANAPVGTAKMSGNGFSFKGLFDYELFDNVWFRGTAGIEMFNAAGGNICGPTNTTTCDAKLTYMTVDFIGRYVFGRGEYRPWVGGGMHLLFPASKEATALNPNSISTTSAFVIAGGLDWFISKTMYVPVSLEYGLLPKSTEVEASWIAIRGGLAFPF